MYKSGNWWDRAPVVRTDDGQVSPVLHQLGELSELEVGSAPLEVRRGGDEVPSRTSRRGAGGESLGRRR